MKFVIEKSVLQTHLGRIQGIAERKSTIPILSNILISSERNDINLVATDLEIGVKETLNATVTEQGAMCVVARKLYDIVRELPEEEVEVTQEENFWVSIKAGRSLFNLPGLDPADFPRFPATESGAAFSLTVAELIEVMESVVFAASTEESRLNLNGIYIERVQGEGKEALRIVATDGHRLSKIDREMKTTLETGIILPKRGVVELKRILVDGETELRVSLKENNCIFQTESTVVVVRLLEGEYPDYRQVIPSGNDRIIKVDRKAFTGAIRRAQVIASEKGEGITFDIGSDQIEIRTGGPDVGSVREELAVDYDGEPLTINFNGRYLLDVLGVLDSELVQLELKEELSAAIIRPVNGKEHIYVVMPMRL
jgi:DNA polymerase-3 subunit beta